jgi:cellulase/cellobiase CelA1
MPSCGSVLRSEYSYASGQVVLAHSSAGSATLTATLGLSSEWEQGYCAEVTVANSGVDPTAAWQVVLDLAESSLTAWWSRDFQVNGSDAIVDSLDYNQTIWPGSFASFGFCASKEGASWSPTVVGTTGM